MKILFISPYVSTEAKPHVAPFIRRIYNELQKDINIVLYSFNPNKKISKYLKARYEIKNIIKRGDFDIIHLNWGHTILVIPFFINTKLVTTFRGSDINGLINKHGKHDLTSRLMFFVSKFAYWRSDFSIFVSKDLKNILNVDRNYAVIPSGVDLTLIPKEKKSYLRKCYEFKDNEIIILFCGNPSNLIKRYNLAKEIIEEVKVNWPNIRLVHVWKKEPREVFRMMKASDFLLQVSIQEGSPNIIKEAIACDLNIVSTPVGDTPERIKHLSNCALSKDLSKYEIVKCLKQSIADFQSSTFNDKKRERIKLTLTKEKAAIIRVYESLID